MNKQNENGAVKKYRSLTEEQLEKLYKIEREAQQKVSHVLQDFWRKYEKEFESYVKHYNKADYYILQMNFHLDILSEMAEMYQELTDDAYAHWDTSLEKLLNKKK